MTAISPSPSSPVEEPAFDISALDTICKGADQVMVYGWKHCLYHLVGQAICTMTVHPDFPIKKVFSYRIGNPSNPNAKTLSGRKLNTLYFTGSDSSLKSKRPSPALSQKTIARECKTALTNLVLENYKRKSEGKPLIPILFCIDIDDNPTPASYSHIATKHPQFNEQITYKELRRAYKLCTHKNVLVRKAALETFKFIKLTKNQEGDYTLKPVPAPWAHSQFPTVWNIRSKVSTSKPKQAHVNWRKQLDQRIREFETSKKLASDKTASAPLGVQQKSKEPRPEKKASGKPQSKKAGAL